MKRTDAKVLRSETALAAKREAAESPERRGYIEWDAVRARIKRIKDPAGRDAEWRKVAAALSALGYR